MSRDQENWLHAQIGAVLTQAKEIVPDQEWADCVHFYEHDEYELAIEHLLFAIDEHGLRLSPGLISQISHLSEGMTIHQKALVIMRDLCTDSSEA